MGRDYIPSRKNRIGKPAKSAPTMVAEDISPQITASAKQPFPANPLTVAIVQHVPKKRSSENPNEDLCLPADVA
jgi:hypothetical protein